MSTQLEKKTEFTTMDHPPKERGINLNYLAKHNLKKWAKYKKKNIKQKLKPKSKAKSQRLRQRR